MMIHDKSAIQDETEQKLDRKTFLPHILQKGYTFRNS